MPNGDQRVGLLSSLDISVLSGEEQRDLLRKARTGDLRARHRLVLHSMGFVRKVAASYAKTAAGAEFDDLVSDGVIGLLKAIDKFDLNYEVQFLTFAGPAVIHEIKRRWEATATAVHVPTNYVVNARRLRRMRRDHEEAGASTVDFDRWAAEEHSPSLVAAMYVLMQQPISMDAPVSEDAEESLQSTFGEAARQEEDYAVAANAARIRRLMGELRPLLSRIEVEILDRRLLVPELDERATFDAIGASVGRSRERIRQIEARLMDRIESVLSDGKPLAKSRDYLHRYQKSRRRRFENEGTCLVCGDCRVDGLTSCARHRAGRQRNRDTAPSVDLEVGE